jgi:transcription antitermination factor NusG
MMPLFAGYLFFCGDEAARYAALATDRLCQVIEVPDQATLVQELSSLHRALQAKASLDPYPYAVVGNWCRVASGPFEGIEGMVVGRDGVQKLVLQVTMLGQSVSMEIDPGQVEAAG